MSQEKRKEPLSHDRSAAAWVGGLILGVVLILGGGFFAAMVLVVLSMLKG